MVEIRAFWMVEARPAHSDAFWSRAGAEPLDRYRRNLDTAVCERRRPERSGRRRPEAELVDAAERLFIGQGFDATSLESVAAEAGYTKGAVYSNFASKEDLFFAVYERRVERFLREAGAHAGGGGRRRRGRQADGRRRAGRRDREDGWLAVFFEFWAHVLRHPEHRARFAALHAQGGGAARRGAGAVRRGAGRGAAARPPAHAGGRDVAMVTGLALERLTQPEVVGRGARL